MELKCFRCGKWPCVCKDGQTIIHGDCRKVLPLLEPVDLVLTDPPWLASKQRRVTRRHGDGFGAAPCFTETTSLAYGDIGFFSKEVLIECFAKTTDMLVICWYMELEQVIEVLRPIRSLFCWHKPGSTPTPTPCQMDCSWIVWGVNGTTKIANRTCGSQVFSYMTPRAGCISNGERILTEKNGPAAHPAQGPVRLYHDLLKGATGTVLDPYLGSGTTLRACKDVGRRGIGIEIEEKYCRMAAKRLRQEVLEFTE